MRFEDPRGCVAKSRLVPEKIIAVNVPAVICIKDRLKTSTAIWSRLAHIYRA